VLLALRRGEYGEEIHALLGPVDKTLADLVQKGQDSEVLVGTCPRKFSSQIAYAAVFAIADNNLSARTSAPRGSNNEPAHPGSSRGARQGAGRYQP